jgi:hypothetical protein
MQTRKSYQGEEKRQRKQRSDKGLVMATRRDQYCLAWISEMYAARIDQVQRLLSRFPDPDKPFKAGDLIAETTVRDMIRRWERAGWIEYRRILADSPGWVWTTKRGLALVDLDDIYPARVPAAHCVCPTGPRGPHPARGPLELSSLEPDKLMGTPLYRVRMPQ